LIRSTLTTLLCMAVMASAATVPRPSPPFVVHLTPGQLTPAQYKGKVVIMAMIMTTCPHCQKTTQVLSGLQKEYGPRGLQVMAAAFEDQISPMAVNNFIKQYQPTFPVGYSSRTEVLTYLGLKPDDQVFVPILVFIDRKGMIRHQYLGDDPFQLNQEPNLRQAIEQLLKEPASAQKAAPATTKKAS